MLEGQPTPSTSGSGWARTMLIAGGALAAWGALVCVGLVYVLVTGASGSGGATPLLAGGLVIGGAPFLVGAILFVSGLKRRKVMRASDRG